MTRQAIDSIFREIYQSNQSNFIFISYNITNITTYTTNITTCITNITTYTTNITTYTKPKHILHNHK